MMMLLPLTLLLLAPSVDVCEVALVVDVVVPGAVLSPDFAETQGCFIVFLCGCFISVTALSPKHEDR